MQLFICIHIDFAKQSFGIFKKKNEQKKQNTQKSPKSCNPMSPDGPKTGRIFPVVFRIMLCFTLSPATNPLLGKLIHSKWLMYSFFHCRACRAAEWKFLKSRISSFFENFRNRKTKIVRNVQK